MNSYTKKISFVDENGDKYPEWEQKKLGEVATSLDNKRVPLSSSQRALIKGDVPYYGATQIVDHINDYIFDEELVLIGEDGVDFKNFQSKPIAQFIQGKSWVNNHAHVFRPDLDLIIPKFLYYSTVHKDVTSFVVGGSRAKLNKSEALKITIHVPSLPEQEKIAEFFSALDERIESTASKVVLLKQQKQGYLQQVFNRELVFTDDNGEQYPEWEQKKLEEVASVTSGKRLPKGHQFTSSGTPYITVSDMGDKRVDHKRFSFISPATETVLQRYKVTKGDVIISIAGTLGKVNLIDASLEQANLTENCDKIRVNERIMPEFIYYVLKSSSIQSDIEKTSTTSSQPKLALEQLRNFSIPTPSLSEQRKIAEFFSVLDERIELNENKLALLKEQKKGYLQGIFG